MVAEPRPKPEPKRSFIARFFIFLFKLVLLIAVLAAGGILGALAATWINLSNATDTAQDQRLSGLQDEVLNQSSASNEMVSSMAALQTEIGSFDSQTAALAADIDALSDQIAAQTTLIDAQDAQIATLTEAQTGIFDDLALAQTDIENLVETTAGLRRNLTTSSQSASGVSQSLTTLETQVADLEASLAEIEASAAVTGTVAADSGSEAGAPVTTIAADSGPKVALTHVRLLGLIARAKIHLLENDSASAGTAIESALELAGDDEALASMADSLETALASVDSKPAAASISLDTAWSELELVLTSDSN